MAEHALGLLLACTRRIGQSVRAGTDRSWIRRPSRFELHGSTVLVLGLGTVGEQVARLAAAFGMHVIGIKRDPATYSGEVADVRGPEQLLDACREADVLISVLPGGDGTRHLIDAEVLDALGRGYLVSLGRGSVVDEAALIDALRTRRLRGAGLDVYATEPLPEDSPLWDLETAVLTPHIGGTSPNYGRRFGEVFQSNLAAYRGRGAWVNRQIPTR
jgi:D-2-hydroxyacid dehydrogenase (NADP+)